MFFPVPLRLCSCQKSSRLILCYSIRSAATTERHFLPKEEAVALSRSLFFFFAGKKKTALEMQTVSGCGGGI